MNVGFAISSNYFLWTNPHHQPFNDHGKKHMRARDNLIKLRVVRLIHVYKVKKL